MIQFSNNSIGFIVLPNIQLKKLSFLDIRYFKDGDQGKNWGRDGIGTMRKMTQGNYELKLIQNEGDGIREILVQQIASHVIDYEKYF